MARPLRSAVEPRNDRPGVTAVKLSRVALGFKRGEKVNFGVLPLARPVLLKSLPGVLAGELEACRCWFRSKRRLPATTDDGATWLPAPGPVDLQLPKGRGEGRPRTSSLTSLRSLEGKPLKEAGWLGRMPRCRVDVSMLRPDDRAKIYCDKQRIQMRCCAGRGRIM
jgi:hypothetical protein